MTVYIVKSMISGLTRDRLDSKNNLDNLEHVLVMPQSLGRVMWPSKGAR